MTSYLKKLVFGKKKRTTSTAAATSAAPAPPPAAPSTITRNDDNDEVTPLIANRKSIGGKNGGHQQRPQDPLSRLKRLRQRQQRRRRRHVRRGKVVIQRFIHDTFDVDGNEAYNNNNKNDGNSKIAFIDSNSDISIARRLSRFLSRYDWYCPSTFSSHSSLTSSSNRASALDNAWAYFEHFTLPRYYCDWSNNTKADDDGDDDDHDETNGGGDAAATASSEASDDSDGTSTSSAYEDLFVKAEPGDIDYPTKLYPIFTTPESQLADMGVGIGIYFYTLRVLSIILFLAGLLSIPNMYYYYSLDYNNNPDFKTSNEWLLLSTSAICTDHSWVPCPNCTKTQFSHFPSSYERYAEVSLDDQDHNDDNTILTFMKINNCHVSEMVGIVSYITMIFVCISIYFVSKIIQHKELVLDEQSQTSSDYSIEIKNPPTTLSQSQSHFFAGDSTNNHDVVAQEYKDYFQQFGHVTSITIALNNEILIQQLLLRRSLLRNLELIQPPSSSSSTLSSNTTTSRSLDEMYEMALPVPWYWKLYGRYDGLTIKEKLTRIDELILTDLMHRQYDVSEVFVIFETEDAQQRCLQTLQQPGINVILNKNITLFKRNNNNDGNNHNHRQYTPFRNGEYVLDVVEAPEPSSVRWQDLDEDWLTLLKQRVITTSITLIMIVCGCLFVLFIRHRYGTVYSALAVTAVNSAAPYICYYTVYYGESHADEGDWQASLYFKITGFLWITTSLLTALVTPFSQTLDNESDSLIPAMLCIFITEMLKSPATQLSDISGHVYRHLMAPRVRDPKRMADYFRGKTYYLSERYTDLTNVLMYTFYYSMLFPAGYFFASMTLAVHYFVDKFCLLRVWAPAPAIGTRIAEMSRTLFFSAAIAVYAIMSSYNFASFPYDNACVAESEVPEEYVGTFNATTGNGVVVDIDVSSDSRTYYFCNQDMVRLDFPHNFPAIPSNQPAGFEWMIPDQNFAYVYGFTCIGILAFVLLILLNKLRKKVMAFFVSPFQKHHKSISLFKFSSLPNPTAYVPEVRVPFDPFPILLCDVGRMNLELIEWEDPDDMSYESHTVTKDMPGLEDKHIFSTVYHWSPTNK